MFVKVTTNSAGQSYYHLVESYRDGGKVKQRTILSLGRVGEDRINDVVSALSKYADVISAVDFAQSVSVENTFVLGPLLILERIFQRFGVDAALVKAAAAHPKLGFDFKRIVFTLVASRFVRPGSKLKIFEYWRKKFFPEMVSPDVDLQQIYRALDLLADHKDELEQDLFWHQRDLLNMQVDVVLYDLTTLRFESTREDLGQLRRFGYSKERRSDCTQVVLGLLVDPEGIPLGFEIYPGNTFEGQTLESIIQKMRAKFKVRRFIFVADRGLFSAKNLEILRAVSEDKKQEQGEFIVGMKLGVFKQRHDEFYDLSRFEWVSEELATYETTHEGDRCIITWSKSRWERDQKAREDILCKIRKKLSTQRVNPKSFVSNRNYQRYLTGLTDGKPAINEKAIAEDSLRDGFFGVLTNIKDMPASQVVENYKDLWVIEDAFGEIKGNLKARPVFHWSDHRIIGHLMVCFLAYYCEAQMTKALRKRGAILKSTAIEEKIIKPRPLTAVEAMRELKEVRAIPVQIKGTTSKVPV